MPPPSSPVAEALAALSAALSEIGAPWYVFGAQAAIVHGSRRATKDIDVTVDADRVGTRALLDALARRHIEPQVPDPESLAATSRVLPLLHVPSGVPIDVVLAGPGLEPIILSRAVLRDVAGALVPVAAADDVVALKILAGRPHDREDVIAILRAQRDAIDVARARETLELLEEALAQSDLVPLLDELVARSRRR